MRNYLFSVENVAGVIELLLAAGYITILCSVKLIRLFVPLARLSVVSRHLNILTQDQTNCYQVSVFISLSTIRGFCCSFVLNSMLEIG